MLVLCVRIKSKELSHRESQRCARHEFYSSLHLSPVSSAPVFETDQDKIAYRKYSWRRDWTDIDPRLTLALRSGRGRVDQLSIQFVVMNQVFGTNHFAVIEIVLPESCLPHIASACEIMSDGCFKRERKMKAWNKISTNLYEEDGPFYRKPVHFTENFVYWYLCSPDDFACISARFLSR